MHWLIFSTFLVSAGAIDQVVRTASGLVGGIEEKTVYGTKYMAFYSIPFAAPPVGSLRLKPPVEPRPWFQVRNVTKWPTPCLQWTKSSKLIGDEDCLYLNVFTPSNNTRVKDALWPVLVYVHPGGYRSGDTSLFPPGYFLEKPVILITFHFRLGPLGFLGYGNNELSGNFGFKDQIFVLKWIKKNIGAFGGNPNEVTLVGNSAGSQSVHFHTFSPLSKGLFHKAILQSGLGTWGFYTTDYARAQATAFAYVTGCYRKHMAQMLSCFQKLKAKEFFNAMNKLYIWGSDPVTIFRPIIEGEGVTDAALPKEPKPENYQSQSIPVIIGTNTGEGVFRFQEYLKNDGKLLKELNEDYIRLFPVVLGYHYSLDPEKFEKFSNRIKEYYFQSRSIGVETDVEMVKVLTDIPFLYPHVQVTKHYPATKYLYVYDHKPNCSGPGSPGCYKDEYGVDHGDENPLIFTQSALPFNRMTVSEKFISAKLIEFFTNFAIYSNPNGPTTDTVWLPVISEQNEYLHITTTEISMKNNFRFERAEFLEKLFSEN